MTLLTILNGGSGVAVVPRVVDRTVRPVEVGCRPRPLPSSSVTWLAYGARNPLVPRQVSRTVAVSAARRGVAGAVGATGPMGGAVVDRVVNRVQQVDTATRTLRSAAVTARPDAALRAVVAVVPRFVDRRVPIADTRRRPLRPTATATGWQAAPFYLLVDRVVARVTVVGTQARPIPPVHVVQGRPPAHPPFFERVTSRTVTVVDVAARVLRSVALTARPDAVLRFVAPPADRAIPRPIVVADIGTRTPKVGAFIVSRGPASHQPLIDRVASRRLTVPAAARGLPGAVGYTGPLGGLVADRVAARVTVVDTVAHPLRSIAITVRHEPALRAVVVTTPRVTPRTVTVVSVGQRRTHPTASVTVRTPPFTPLVDRYTPRTLNVARGQISHRAAVIVVRGLVARIPLIDRVTARATVVDVAARQLRSAAIVTRPEPVLRFVAVVATRPIPRLAQVGTGQRRTHPTSITARPVPPRTPLIDRVVDRAIRYPTVGQRPRHPQHGYTVPTPQSRTTPDRVTPHVTTVARGQIAHRPQHSVTYRTVPRVPLVARRTDRRIPVHGCPIRRRPRHNIRDHIQAQLLSPTGPGRACITWNVAGAAVVFTAPGAALAWSVASATLTFTAPDAALALTGAGASIGFSEDC